MAESEMTQDEIIRMAREAGFEGLIEKAWGIEQLERFAALVAAHERNKNHKTGLLDVLIEKARLDEREACAKVCDAVLGENNVSAAIRARGEK